MKKEKFIEKVFDETNSINEPWIMNVNLDESYKDPLNGELLSAEYIWSQQQNKRDELLIRIFNMLRTKQFEDIIPKLSIKELKNKYQNLINSDYNSVFDIKNNEIVNSNAICTDVLKHFCGDLFYSTTGDQKNAHSCREIFNNDEKLIKVLKNRMGYRISKEDGKERPYVFSLSDKMIFQGMRSSGLAHSTSTFKPMLARFIVGSKEINNTNGDLIFDYSSGWGARALGVGSLNKRYFGIDPLTYKHVNNMLEFYKINGKVFNGGSENKDSYKELEELNLKNKFNLCFSSPPYFTLEKYSDQITQSTNLYSTYNDWLNYYWRNTVNNCIDYVLTKTDRTFILIMVEKYKKYNLINDMVKICEESGLKLNKIYNIRTSKSHLSGKVKLESKTKNTEKILIFK